MRILPDKLNSHIKKTDKKLDVAIHWWGEQEKISFKQGNTFTKMYPVNKFVSQYYIYIDNEKLGLCYLKISSYIPFVSEFYFNGHNYLKKQFDLEDKKYTMNDNSFTKVEDLGMLDDLVTSFQPSIALDRIGHWMDIFFKSWPNINYRGGLP